MECMNPTALFNLAMALESTPGRMDEAVIYYTKTLEIDLDEARMRGQSGEELERTRVTHPASAALKKCSEKQQKQQQQHSNASSTASSRRNSLVTFI